MRLLCAILYVTMKTKGNMNTEKPINSAVEAEKLLLWIVPNTEFTGHAYSVGGFLRDTLLGIEPKDLDVVIDVKDGAEGMTKALHAIFKNETYPPRQMGEHYPIWQLVFKEDVTVNFNGFSKTYWVGGAEVEFADTMTESYPDDESRQREVKFGTIQDDVLRRDFSINSLMRNLTTGELCDFGGNAIEDIKNRIIRTTRGVSADVIFTQDPLRILRAIRFYVVLEALTGEKWTIPCSVLKAMRRNSHRISIISMERFTAELKKIMVMAGLWKALRIMKATRILERSLPEIHAMIDCDQPLKFHGEGSVWNHTLKTLQNARPGILDQLAAMLHDVGKPLTRTEEDGEIHFYKHEWKGSDLATEILERLKFDGKVVEEVSYVVKWHMRPHSLHDASRTALRRFLRETPEKLIQPLLDVAEADERGSIPDLMQIPKLRAKLSDPELLKIPIRRKPVLDGFDIMSALKVKPGPVIGEAGEWLMNLEDEYAAKGETLTKQDAMVLIKDFRKDQDGE